MPAERESATMEERLAGLGRRLDQLNQKMHRAQETEVRPRVREEIDVWKQMLDEFRVHAELGRMEARDRLDPLLSEMDRLSGQIERTVSRVRNLDEWDELEESVLKVSRGLSRELAGAEELRQ